MAASPPSRTSRSGPGEQRQRLLAAMLEAVRDHGYQRTTIDELVRRAAVSKRAFYQEFDSKQACFLATYEEIVGAGANRIVRAFDSDGGLGERLETVLGELVDLAIERPAELRLVVIDSLALGADSVQARRQTLAGFEELIAAALAGAAAPAPVSEVKVRAVVGGIRSVLYRALRDGEPERLRGQVEELTRWGLGYRKAAERRAASGELSAAQRLVGAVRAAEQVPSDGDGETGLGWGEPANSPRARAELSQRQRILRGAVQATARRGYAALSIPAISAAAGTSNQTFYEQFASPQEAFLAGFEELTQRAFMRVAMALGGHDGWLEGGAAGIAALLECFVADPLFTAISFYELPAAGTEAQAKAETLLEAFMLFLRPDPLPEGVARQPPQVIVEALAGGLWAAVEGEVIAGRVESLPELAPELVDLVLVPFGVE